jgi:hypothetical protein
MNIPLNTPMKIPTYLTNENKLTENDPFHAISFNSINNTNVQQNQKEQIRPFIQKQKQNKKEESFCACELVALCIIAIFVGTVLLVVGFVYGNETIPTNPSFYDEISTKEHLEMAPGLKISGGILVGVSLTGLVVVYLFPWSTGFK